MSGFYDFHEVARLPLPGDNVAIAIRQLESGTKINYQNETFTIDYTVMEGHRFAVKTIAKGEPLLSWELPFGIALQTIESGNYVINNVVLEELRGRSLDIDLPTEANFADGAGEFKFDEANFRPESSLPAYEESRTFMGYRRSQARGVGTRNTIVLLGTTSHASSYVKQLAERLKGEVNHYQNVDGIVPVSHTEGGTERPNNLELLLRTLAGFMVHPNVGAVLVVDHEGEHVNNKMLESYLKEHNYPVDDVSHRFLSLSGEFNDLLAKGEKFVREWLPVVNEVERTAESIRHLKIALQCGGSDAFSGVSANPLLGWVSKELIRYGGAANLAETDELIGAETYVLQKVRNIETARKFLNLVDQFKERTAWHGADAEGNPSGGNKYRGLYNITLKSIGAARKKDPQTRLDFAIDYGEPMKEAGYYFMDSPGNDLESIAGQVAAGCNLIFFTTGNGSITNFPFVPTIKVVTTTERFELLSKDMDVNAGQYQDGLPMEELGSQTFDLMLRIASGQKSVGERAGHSQVQIWRNWQQTDDSQLEKLMNASVPKGIPLPIHTDVESKNIDFSYSSSSGRSSRQIALILPTSLCSGQVANMISADLNEKRVGQPDKISRFVALAHTEGCGNSGGNAEELYARTMVGYIHHPMVRHCLLLEHGCEKTHNAFMRNQIVKMGGDPNLLGFASIQLDGGIERVSQIVKSWFADQIQMASNHTTAQDKVELEGLRIGIMTDGTVSKESAEQLAILTKCIVGAGGTVVVPENCDLFTTPAFRDAVLKQSTVHPSLAYGEHAKQVGFHMMETPTQHWVETMTGMGATGVEIILGLVNERPMQVHPFVPVLQMASKPEVQQTYSSDLDLLLNENSKDLYEQILDRVKQVIEQSYTPRLYQQGNVDFQFTRGRFGVSL